MGYFIWGFVLLIDICFWDFFREVGESEKNKNEKLIVISLVRFVSVIYTLDDLRRQHFYGGNIYISAKR
jgi:hypothetical protein